MSSSSRVLALCILFAAGCGRTPVGNEPVDGGIDPLPDAGECVRDVDCTDGNACNGEETCVSGHCTPGGPIDCIDDLGCTIDSCDPLSGDCTHSPDHELCDADELCVPPGGCVFVGCEVDDECDDGVFCNGREYCNDAGVCAGSGAPDCDDGAACTTDGCDEAIDACVYIPDHRSCDNGRVCDGREQCVAWTGCIDGDPIDCDDGDECTVDRCVDEEGGCLYFRRDRDGDGYPDGECGGPDCDDFREDINPGAREICGDRVDNDCNGRADCADEVCFGTPGCDCVPEPEICDDGDDNDCDRLVDCEDREDCADHPRCETIECTGADDCDDGRFCNGPEMCAGGRCIPGRPPICDDGVDCTRDSCDEATAGCVFRVIEGFCEPGERCDAVRGCVREGCTSDRECDNGRYCDGEERCLDDGTCSLGAVVRCIDTFDCTMDFCDEERDRCTSRPNHALCDNGRFCDGEERCDPERGCVEGRDPCPGGGDCWEAICIEDERSCERDFLDEDGDSFPPVDCGGRDCDDENPEIHPRAEEICDDRIDNNCNELVDCFDPLCAADPRCCEPTGDEVCDDRVDNDCDGRSDCSDRDCALDPACRECDPEVCWDTLDNDCDDLIDCEDPDCAAHFSCRDCEPEICDDDRDNDCDGRVDCDDPDCEDSPDCGDLRNDSCATALDVTGGGTFEGSTSGLHDDYSPVAGRPDCWGGSGPDAVFYFRLSEPAMVTIDTFGSSFDTVLYLRVGHCTAGDQVECNDDTGDGVQSEIIMGRLARGIYFLFLDGFWEEAEGDYELHIDIAEPGSEICDDDRDNDGDGAVDCDDTDCEDSAHCRCIPTPEVGVEACTDRRDNDCDGLVDCDDEEDCAVSAVIGECCNRLDDNGNGVIDEFACRCESDRECRGGGNVCYAETLGACGPRCNELGGDVFCDFVAPGSSCDRRSGRCEP